MTSFGDSPGLCVDAQPSGSIPTSQQPQQQTDGQSGHPNNTKQPKVESTAFEILHDNTTPIWEFHCLR